MFRTLFLWLIRGYRAFVSPWLPAACRFHPTCSEYALEAVERYGAFRGGWLTLRRLGRCHPWGGKGFDPVPVRPEELHAVRSHPGRKEAGLLDVGEANPRATLVRRKAP